MDGATEQPTATTADALLRLPVVCARLGVCRSTLAQWIADGKVAVVVLGPRLRRVRASELARFVAQRERPCPQT